MHFEPIQFDDYGNMYEFPRLEIDAREAAKIVHEINTNFKKYEHDGLGVHYSYARDNRCYAYYFENHGFNNYNIYAKKLAHSKRR